MLAKHEAAIIDALRARPGLQNTLRTVAAIPAVPNDKLLSQYVTDAPAVYVAAPLLQVRSDLVVLSFTLVVMVSNVASRQQARNGNSGELGVDQLFTLVCRTVHGKRLGDASWSVTRAEFADDDLFVKHGLTALAVYIESTGIEMPYEVGDGVDDISPDMTLDDLRHVHLDMDIAPHAVSTEYGKWLQTPPDYTASRPDAQADILLPGAST